MTAATSQYTMVGTYQTFNIIKQQLGTGNLMNWGCHKFGASPANDIHRGQLTCKVSGWNYKQPVYLKITLTQMDLYDVELIRINTRTYKTLHSVSGVYANQLGQIIQNWLNGGQ